jgi:siroheme synthase (precorrin-2 oxidase/ferrochelatase)
MNESNQRRTNVCREFAPADLDGAWLVVAAATPEVNRAVAQAAEDRRLFVNAVDDPEVATWSPSDSARIKQITLLRRQPKKNPAPQESATKQ